MTTVHALTSAHDRITEVGFQLSKAALAAIVLSYIGEVGARYAFGSPFVWTEELVSYALCIGCFLAMPACSKAGGQIAILFLFEVVDPRTAVVLKRVVALATALVCFVVAYISLAENVRQVTNGISIVSVYSVPKVYIAGFITYGFLSSAIYFLRSAVSSAPPVDAAQSSQV